MIDIWFVFTMLMPFGEVILHTMSDQLRLKLKNLDKSQQESVSIKVNNKVNVVPAAWSLAAQSIMAQRTKIFEKLKLIQYIGKFCLPSIFVCFSVTFITIGLYLKYTH